LSDPSSYSFLSLEIKFKVFFSIVIIFFKKIINDNDNNKNNTNDYKLGSDDPARPKFKYNWKFIGFLFIKLRMFFFK